MEAGESYSGDIDHTKGSGGSSGDVHDDLEKLENEAKTAASRGQPSGDVSDDEAADTGVSTDEAEG